MAFKFSDGQSEITGDFSRLEKLIEGLDGDYSTDVGVFEKSKYPDGTPVAQIGAVHEFGQIINHPGGTSYILNAGGQARFVKTGTPGISGVTGPHDIPIPKRSFIRMPIETKQDKIAGEVEKVSGRFLEKGDIRGLFSVIGLACENAIREAFASKGFGTWADNADSTVNRKHSSMPLKDKGLLEQAITHRVNGGER